MDSYDDQHPNMTLFLPFGNFFDRLETTFHHLTAAM